MFKNIFITGERDIGKSYAVDSVIKELGLKVSGFKTHKVVITGEIERVYICDINEAPEYKTDNCVAEIICKKPGYIYANVFDTEGVRLLRESGAKLTVMDELGFLEKDALLFKEAVTRCVESEKPLLGVLHAEKRAPWVIDSIKDKAMLFELDGKNNKRIIQEIIGYFSKLID